MNTNAPFSVYLQITRKAFKPAKKIKKRTWVVTTETLAEKIKSIYPNVATDVNQLCSAMKHNGFEKHFIPGIGLRWIMKPKKKWPQFRFFDKDV